MASVHPEEKGVPTWGWVIGAVVAVIVVVAAVLMIRGEVDQPVPEPGEPVAEVDAYSDWVQDELQDYEAEEANTMAADGFERIADALEGVRDAPETLGDPADPADPQEPGAQEPNADPAAQQQQDQPIEDDTFQREIDSIRASADSLRADELEQQHSEYARTAALTTVEVLQRMQARGYAGADFDLQPVEQAAENIDADRGLEEQRESLQEFFLSVEDALLNIRDLPRDPRDEPGALPETQAPGASNGADAPGGATPNNRG